MTQTGIPFTQYLMPHGRKDRVWIDRPADIEAMAQRIIAAGYRFECEMLSDYSTCSFTITDDKLGDVDIEIAPNGQRVLVAIDEMITRFAETLPATGAA